MKFLCKFSIDFPIPASQANPYTNHDYFTDCLACWNIGKSKENFQKSFMQSCSLCIGHKSCPNADLNGQIAIAIWHIGPYVTYKSDGTIGCSNVIQYS